MHRAWLLLTVGVIALAGCADDPAPAVEDDERFGDIRVSDSTGAIRGLVLDPSIVPVEGATVRIVNGAQTLSDAEGAFVFDDLEPGTYFLEIEKLGYRAAQQSADVVAGVASPDIVKVQLIPAPETLPQASTQSWDGYLACGFGAAVASFNPCADAGSDNVHNFTVERVPAWVQVEMVWKGTNVLGDSLSIGISDPNGLASDFVGADCGSPCSFRVSGEDMVAALGPDFTEFTVRVFPGTGADGTSASVVLDQGFSVYVTEFHRFDPDEGWLFVESGPYPVPQ